MNVVLAITYGIQGFLFAVAGYCAIRLVHHGLTSKRRSASDGTVVRDDGVIKTGTQSDPSPPKTPPSYQPPKVLVIDLPAEEPPSPESRPVPAPLPQPTQPTPLQQGFPAREFEGMRLSDEQCELFEEMESTNTSLFISGKAGTGKSVLLRYFMRESKKRMAVVAFTGVAAINIGGETIHSLFRFPLQVLTKEEMARHNLNEVRRHVLETIDTLVIDEISMVRADHMHGIDLVLQKVRHNNLPYGGVQIIAFGDLFQLPPIVGEQELHKYFRDTYDGQFFFHSPAETQEPLQYRELETIHRQRDSSFIKLLNEVRVGAPSESVFSELNKRVVPVDHGAGVVTTLCAHNAKVQQINERHLASLGGKSYTYEAVVSGEMREKDFPTEKHLILKPGAQIMMVKNDPEKRWVNGTIGVVKSLSNDGMTVTIGGFDYPVPRETWDKFEYTYDAPKKKLAQVVVGSFMQYPVKLAWAMTIHKAQGSTLDSVVIDLGGEAFAPGQTYVALSRCTSLGGIYLPRRITPGDIKTDPDVIEYMHRANQRLEAWKRARLEKRSSYASSSS